MALYRYTVLADTPYAYWKLDEQIGTLASDIANNRNATYTNNPTRGQPRIPANDDGFSTIFPGATEHVISTFLLNSSTVTIEAWVIFSAFPASGRRQPIVTFAEGNGASTHDKALHINDTGTIGFYVFDGGAKFATSAQKVSLNTPYHLVGRVDGSAAKVFINGAEAGTIGATGSFTGYTVPNVVTGGIVSGNNFDKFIGNIDEVAIYNSALLDARILAHYQAGLSQTPLAHPIVQVGG